MKVYCKQDPRHGYAQQAFHEAMCTYAPPGMTCVERKSEADFQIVSFLGDIGAILSLPSVLFVQDFKTATQKYGKHRPISLDAWRDLFGQVIAVISYYDLSEFAPPDKFFLTPFGVDPGFVKYNQNKAKTYDLLTTGYVSETESIGEAWKAIALINGRGIHIGGQMDEVTPNLRRFGEYALNVSQNAMYRYMSQTKYVSAMRQPEGFEVVGYEGVLAGARPIVLDLPCYHRWYKDMPIYVPHKDPHIVVRLAKILKQSPKPITQKERDYVLDTMSWSVVAPKIWEFIQSKL